VQGREAGKKKPELLNLGKGRGSVRWEERRSEDDVSQLKETGMVLKTVKLCG